MAGGICRGPQDGTRDGPRDGARDGARILLRSSICAVVGQWRSGGLTYIYTYILKIRPSHYIHVSFDSSFAYKTASRFE